MNDSIPRFAKLALLAALTLSILAPALARAGAVEGRPNGECPQFAPMGFPFPADKAVAARAWHVCHRAYSTYVDPATRTPLWSAEQLSSQGLDAEESRTNDFRPDPDIPGDIQARSQRDFSHSGYDQGHMSPAGDFRGFPQDVMSESFYYSNIVPQNADNNRHAWEKLEVFTRQWAQARGKVYVVTGPIFSEGKSLGTLGAGIAIPTHLFKVVIDYDRRQAMAFVLPNQPISPDGGGGSLKAWERTLAKYEVSVADVEAWSGLRFDMNMAPADRAALHAQRGPMWSTRKGR